MIIDLKLNTRDHKIHFTSDTHYNHKNIVRGTSEWGGTRGQRLRPFNTLKEHNDALIENFNKQVDKDDILFHLGDWSFGGLDALKEFYDALNCHNIFFLLGNHDHHIKFNKMLGDTRAKSLFMDVQKDMTITVDRQIIVLHHYAKRVWDKSHKGAWHLYGHSHGTLPSFGKSMDCGVDTHPEFRPYSFNEIKIWMDKQEIIVVDHHNSKTD